MFGATAARLTHINPGNVAVFPSSNFLSFHTLFLTWAFALHPLVLGLGLGLCLYLYLCLYLCLYLYLYLYFLNRNMYGNLKVHGE